MYSLGEGWVFIDMGANTSLQLWEAAGRRDDMDVSGISAECSACSYSATEIEIWEKNVITHL